jgi:hypothetical protein
MKTKTVKLTVGIYFLLIITVALILGSCKSSGHACDAYGKNSIKNPENQEFIEEIAFNEGVAPEEVTQIMFNQRYIK